MDYRFDWLPRPANEQIQTYWLWRRVPLAPFWSLAGVTTNSSHIWVSNVNTILRYEWSLSASNRLGMGDPGNIVPTPANPRPVTGARLAQIRMIVPSSTVIESGSDLTNWTDRYLIFPTGSNKLLFSYCLLPGEQMQFWRWRTLTNDLSAVVPKP